MVKLKIPSTPVHKPHLLPYERTDTHTILRNPHTIAESTIQCHIGKIRPYHQVNIDNETDTKRCCRNGESGEPPPTIRSTRFWRALPILLRITKMKASLSILISLLVAVAAEAPRFRSRFLARQEAAPYPPSGWRPNGPEFMLPTEQRPNTDYGGPVQEYGSPVSEPESTTEPESENVATAIATAIAKGERLKKPKSERLTELKEEDPAANAGTVAAAAAAPQNPFYYVLPDGHFQKLVLAPSAEYYSKLQAQHSPLLVYSPQYVQVY